MQTEPEAKEPYSSLTVIVPISVLERLRPYAQQRTKSKFVSAAITAALDQADQEPEPAKAKAS